MPAGGRPAETPGLTFLHVQGSDGSPTRVFELPDGPVRLGGGALCEIQLACSGLSDVQCLLHPRAGAWHLQPVGPPGQIWVDGRPADARRPLAFGIPFRVGDDWLTLRSPENATNDWGSFAAPITIEPRPDEAPAEPARPAAAPVPPPSPAPERPRAVAAPAGDADDRVHRWQSRVEARERWLKDQQEEKRWEARWKSAGETIRARAAQPAPPPPRTPTSPPSPRTTEARSVVPRPAEPLRRPAGPDRRPFPPREPIRPRALSAPATPAPPPPPRPEPQAPPVPVQAHPEVRSATIARPPHPFPATGEDARLNTSLLAGDGSGGISAPPTTSEHLSGPRCDPQPEDLEIRSPAGWAFLTDREDSVQAGMPARPMPLPTLPGSAKAARAGTEIEAEIRHDPAAGLAEAPGEEIAVEAAPEVEVEAGSSRVGPPPLDERPPSFGIEWEELPPFVTDTFDSAPNMVWVEPTTWPEVAPPPPAVEVPAIAARLVPEPAARPDAGPSPREIAAEPRSAGVAWPSARSIFAAQGSREATGAGPAPGRRRRPAAPEPTEARAPAQWSMPLWLGWFPTTALVLALGLGGLALSVAWLGDATSGDLAARIALRPEGAAGPAIDPASISRGPWWRTTAPHLAAWAVAIERAGDGEDHSAERRELIEDAANASRLGARARFFVEAPAGTEPRAADDLAHLGRTRDVVALAVTGRELRRLGKVEAATRAYRSALAIASAAGRPDLPAPAFDESPPARRYALPHEAILAGVAKEMAGAGAWSPEQWAEALPRFTPAYLAAARALRPGDPAGADRLLDLAARLADEAPPAGLDAAEHRAGAAEALALRGRWTDSAAAYRLAIEGADDDTTRRMWSLNLAEVAQRLGDFAARARALDAAKDVELGDEVTRRAAQYSQAPSSLADQARRP